ncbi:MAG: penicillin-binding protein activator [Herminiimonas sp.]|nr:penicillin-binding protein activator [Herminiimonas sp.]
MPIRPSGRAKGTAAIALLLAFLMSACSTPQPPVKQAVQVVAVPKKLSTVEDALQLQDDGRVIDAAHAFVDVHRQSMAADRARYLFDAAQLYLSVQDVPNALDMLKKLKASAPSSAYGALLGAQLALADGNVFKAMTGLTDTRLRELGSAGKGVYWSTMAEAYRLSEPTLALRDSTKASAGLDTGQSYVLRSLHAHIRAEEFLASTRELSAHQESIWQLLAVQSVPALKSFREQTGDNAERGWIDLALLSKDGMPPGRAKAKAIAAWRKRYPSHVILDQRLLDLNNADKARMRHLALILPTRSKELGASARAVWEGFQSVQAKTPGPFPVKLYETDEKAESTINAYNTAVDNGAILIVGPLPRSALKILAKRKLLSVPTVALNVIDTETVPVNLYQFGLPITHEAKLIARAARDKGFTEAIVLRGSSPLDLRSAEAFAREWTQLKRSVKVSVSTNDAAAITRATTTGNAASTMVFVAADFRNALPAINMMPASWNVFGTSTLNTLSPEAAKLDKSRHVYFVDSPSLVRASKEASRVPPAISRDAVTLRLYWLGVDVCRLSVLLLNEEVRFNRPVMDGATGTLRVTRGRLVERDLQVVSFQEANLARYHASDFDRLAEVRQKRN